MQSPNAGRLRFIHSESFSVTERLKTNISARILVSTFQRSLKPLYATCLRAMPSICELCAARPYFGMPGERARFCGEHRDTGMVDVGHKTCELCSERAYYGRPGWPVARCSDHKRDGDIQNPNKRCSGESCREPALYGKTSAERCEAHKLPVRRLTG